MPKNDTEPAEAAALMANATNLHILEEQQTTNFLKNENSFSDTRIRHGFLRKVYIILLFQIMITMAIGCVVRFVPECRDFIGRNTSVLWASIIGSLIIVIVLSACESVSRRFPMNLLLLFVFTMFESILIGYATIVYETDSILMGIGITLVLVVGLTIFSFPTKYDFTNWGVYLMILLLLLLVFGIVSIFLHSRIVEIIYGALGAGLFSVYIIYDTQLMMVGRYKYSISPEDYVLAALKIYLDIINLFLMIMRLFAKKK
jgi:FtsH-binding integral membrane protein